MPSGPPEWHEKWCDKGPSTGGDWNAISFLKDAGYHLTKRWTWIKPEPDHVVTDEEGNAIDYLIMEWDFDGIEDAKPCGGCGSLKTLEHYRNTGYIACCPDRNDLRDLSIPRKRPKPYKGILFRHKKGGIYLRLLEVVHTETLQILTVYVHLWPHKVGGWARPTIMFDEPERFRRLL